jgi:hypothetical protein
VKVLLPISCRDSQCGASKQSELWVCVCRVKIASSEVIRTEPYGQFSGLCGAAAGLAESRGHSCLLDTCGAFKSSSSAPRLRNQEGLIIRRLVGMVCKACCSHSSRVAQ